MWDLYEVKLSNTFQPKMDGQAEHTIQTLEDILRECVIQFKCNWDYHLPLMEFSYKNNYHSTISMVTFEALYGRRCRSPVGWYHVGKYDLLGPNLFYEAIEKDHVIRDRLKPAQTRQKSYADNINRYLEF